MPDPEMDTTPVGPPSAGSRPPTKPVDYRLERVAVQGGELPVGIYGRSGPAVLALHGVSSTHRLWSWTAPHAPDYQLFAPDLRGHGGAFRLPGPFGMAAHADDALRVLDALRLESALVAGMSMGGFVALALAERAPDRVRGLLLVDGGLPMVVPPGVTEENIGVLFADRFARTDQRFGSFDDYAKLFLSTTGALVHGDDPLAQEYLRYDLDGEEPEHTIRLSRDALATDVQDVFFGAGARGPAAPLPMPVRMLCAEWSVGAGSPPGYSDETVSTWAGRLPQLHSRRVSGVDHATIVMSSPGGREIAAELAELDAESRDR